MKNITKTMKYIPVFILAFGLFTSATPVFATQCWANSGPSWMNCNAQDGNDDNNDDDNNDGDNDSDNLNVSTLSASSIEEDSATLRGDITDLDESEDYERFFEWGTDEDDLDRTATLSGDTDNEGTFSKTISNLNDDTEYFYRACAEEVDGNDDDCGNSRSFTTDEDGGSNNDNDDDNDNNDSDGEGSILTTDASSVTTTSAIINGVVTNDSGSQTVWFEWGSTTFLGNRTAYRVITSHQSIVSAQIYGLTPGRAYFFRLISSNGEEGEYKAFVTDSAGVIHTNTNTGSNTGNDNDDTSSDNEDEGDNEDESNENDGPSIIETIQYFNMNLVTSAKEVAPGSTISIEVVYENLHSETLKNVVIALDFPPGLTPTDSELGTFVTDRQIEVMFPAIAPFSKANFTITAEVYEKLANDTFLVTVAEATYDHPVQGNTRIQSVTSSIVKVSNNVAIRGGSTSGGNQSANSNSSGASFFPKTIIGWLVLTGGIALILILANLIYKKKDIKKTTLKIAR
jgi:hypothetical protein